MAGMRKGVSKSELDDLVRRLNGAYRYATMPRPASNKTFVVYHAYDYFKLVLREAGEWSGESDIFAGTKSEIATFIDAMLKAWDLQDKAWNNA